MLLDLNALAAGQAFVALGTFAVSDDGNQLAYSLDTTGYRQNTLFVRDLRTGEPIGSPLERVDDAVWLADNRTLVYVTHDAITKRADAVRRQTARTPHGELLFFETDDAYDVGIRRTREGAHIIITSTATDTTERRVLSALMPADAPRVFAPRRDGIRYELDAAAGRFYIRTNEDAPDFRVLSVWAEAAQSADRVLVVPERAGTTITGIELFAQFGAVLGRRDGFPSIEILDLVTHALTPLTFDEPDYAIELGDNEEYRASSLRFVFESFIVPRSTFDFHVASGKRTLPVSRTTDRRRCCCTATGRTVSRSTRTFRRRASRCSTAASSSPSREHPWWR